MTGRYPSLQHHNREHRRHGRPGGDHAPAVMLASLLAALAVAGCAPLQQQSESLQTLADQVQDLSAQVDTMSVQVDTALAGRTETQTFRDTIRTDLESLSRDVDRLPAAVASRCRTSAQETAAETCDTASVVQTVVATDGKMLVGELEHIFIDPPGLGAVARVDTGAQSSSLHAANLVAFERDGEDWVRFNLEGDSDAIMIERRVERHVKVFQQADRIGSRRPVIRLRIQLGNVRDTFDFTIADRSHLEYQVLLGRNFLTDIALVDVAQQFVQPRTTRAPALEAAN